MNHPFVRILYFTAIVFAAWIATDGGVTAVSSLTAGGSGGGKGCDDPGLDPAVVQEIQLQNTKGHKCVSGARTHEEQKALWDAHGGVRDGAVAPPGSSLHEQKKAADWGERFEPTYVKRLNNAAHEGNTHGSTTGG